MDILPSVVVVEEEDRRVMFSPCSDVANAQWITARDQHWWNLVTLGPTGLAAYARLRFIPDPAYEAQSENEGARQAGVLSASGSLSESEQFRIAVETLLQKIGSITEGYLLMWDGYGDSMIPEPVLRTPRVLITDDEASPNNGTSTEHVVSPARGYYLVQVSLSDFVSGAVEQAWQASTGLPMPTPAFIWPADQAWCITSDVDPHWAGIGAEPALIDSLLIEPRLDVVRVEADQKLPFY